MPKDYDEQQRRGLPYSHHVQNELLFNFSMKKHILDIIYTEFEAWSAKERFCCGEGCATCCTRNVTITELEAENILEYCIKNNLRSWLIEKLGNLDDSADPLQTTNEYVHASLHNSATVQEPPIPQGNCPFLHENKCTIYSVRPFSCRCFASATLCTSKCAATIGSHYLYGSMVAMQIIEHLCQFQYWGYMTDVLLQVIETKHYEALTDKARMQSKPSTDRLLRAQPIPGFIIPQDQQEQVNNLLQAIFRRQLGSRTIEQILNGR